MFIKTHILKIKLSTRCYKFKLLLLLLRLGNKFVSIDTDHHQAASHWHSFSFFKLKYFVSHKSQRDLHLFESKMKLVLTDPLYPIMIGCPLAKGETELVLLSEL